MMNNTVYVLRTFPHEIFILRTPFYGYHSIFHLPKVQIDSPTLFVQFTSSSSSSLLLTTALENTKYDPIEDYIPPMLVDPANRFSL